MQLDQVAPPEPEFSALLHSNDAIPGHELTEELRTVQDSQ